MPDMAETVKPGRIPASSGPVIYARVHPLTHKAVRHLSVRTGIPMATIVDRLLRDALRLPQDEIGKAILATLRSGVGA